MKLQFIGADHEVTGSCHFIEVSGKRILLDCGMEQGKDIFVNQSIPVKSSEIDYVFLSHAHMDHSGLLPLLYKEGFQGQIFATTATSDLCNIMLRDSAHIQEFEAEWRNRKGKRSGKPAYEPIYTMDDALGAISLFVPCPYDTIVEVNKNIRIRFTDIGHLLGSACIEIWLREDGIEKKLVFSGDVGNIDQPIINDPEIVEEADYVIVESTYGDRTHGERPDYVKEFTRIIQETFDRGGNLVIPSFAVGRTQEILYIIRDLKQHGKITGHDGFEVYVDSPLAIEATTIFDKYGEECFDEEALEILHSGVKPFIFPGLKTTVTSDESKQINFNTAPKVIISASGMAEAGRIRHHLKHNLWRPESTILFVGYQAEGTLGRKLLEGATSVKLFGEDVVVRANIEKLNGVSGHADVNGLLGWLKGFSVKPDHIFVVHGEDEVTDVFAKTIEEVIGVPADAPYSGGEVDLITGEIITLGEPIRIEPKEAAGEPAGSARAEGGRGSSGRVYERSEATRKAEEVFAALVASGEKLERVIRMNEGSANADLRKFTAEIQALCEKWDRN